MGAPNANSLVFTGANYNVVLRFPSGNFYTIITAETLDWDLASEGETIHAIGFEDPIAEKSNANSYKGKFSLQQGELNAILLLEGLATAIQVRGATLAVTAVNGLFKRTFKGVNFNRESSGPKRGSKETLVNVDYACQSIA